MMESDFSYYLIIENNKGRTPLLMNDYDVDEYGIEYLYSEVCVAEDHVTHLSFLQKIKKPAMDTDCLTLETFNVFSRKVRDALIKSPVKGLQLAQASIEGGEYTDFYIANIYQSFYTFDKALSRYKSIDDIGWNDIIKIVLDKDILSAIPLEDRLVYLSKEDCQYTLYHQSVIDTIKSVNPVGMRFIPVENWHEGIAFEAD